MNENIYECMNDIELSKNVWNLKDHGLDNNLSWEIHKKAMFVGKSFRHLC